MWVQAKLFQNINNIRTDNKIHKMPQEQTLKSTRCHKKNNKINKMPKEQTIKSTRCHKDKQ